MHEDKPLKILVVDDTPQNLVALQAVIDDPGVTLITAESGIRALELLLEHDVALALLDVQMPGMDGYELAELMRGAERTRHVPIIFVTASGQEAQRRFRGYEAGAVDFIVKPLDAMVLRSKVRVFCDLAHQRILLADRLAEHERLQRLNRLMLAALTYDIRTPLTALSLNAEVLLRRDDPIGARIKSATAMLSRQVDHLVNMVTLPCDTVRPLPQPGHLAALVRDRLQAPVNLPLMSCTPVLDVHGDDRASYDAALLSEALDQLLLQVAVHCGDHPVSLVVDGNGLHAVTLRIASDGVLNASAHAHLIGSGQTQDGLATGGVGPGLDRAERAVRAHGGSLVGRSKERVGTIYELLLPRGLDG